MTLNTTQRRRLERAGFVPVQVGKSTVGWVPAAFGKRIADQIKAWVEETDKIITEAPKPRGRPKKPSGAARDLT